MAWKKPTVKRITADISNISIYLRSQKKFGKTTLFRDVIMEKYGDPQKGLLVCCGNEVGDTMLDNINSTCVETYEDLVDLGNWLIQEKGKEHNIEMVAFDTVDEFMLICDKETIRRYNEDAKNKCRSIKGAFGGYGAGTKYSANNISKPYFTALKKAGFGIWAIAHTNFKTIREKGGLDEDGYMQLTSNLEKDAESAFGDVFDVVLTGVIDRDVETKKEKGFNNTVKTKNYVTNTVRKLYFRGTTLIDAGGRFAADAVPEYMIFDKQNMAKEFIETVEEGIEKSKTDTSPITDTDRPKTEKVVIPLDGDNDDSKDELKDVKSQIVEKCKELGGTKNEALMDLLSEYVPSKNPNAIKEIDKAKELLTKLNDIKGV